MPKESEIEHEYEDVDTTCGTKTVEPIPSPNSKFKQDREYMFNVIARSRSFYDDNEILETEDLDKVLQVMPYAAHQANIDREVRNMTVEITKMFERDTDKKRQPKEWVFYAKLREALAQAEVDAAPKGQWKGTITAIDFQKAVNEALSPLKPDYVFKSLDFFGLLRDRRPDKTR